MSLIIREKIPTFNYIIDNIYLGDKEAVELQTLLLQNKIEIVINISNSRYTEFEGITYFHFDIDDNKIEIISQFFKKIDIIIDSNKNKNILIHCMNSVSRSVTLVLYYLLNNMNLHDSLCYLKSKRTQYTKPNNGFIKQLLEIEKNKYGSNSVNIRNFY